MDSRLPNIPSNGPYETVSQDRDRLRSKNRYKGAACSQFYPPSPSTRPLPSIFYPRCGPLSHQYVAAAARIPQGVSILKMLGELVSTFLGATARERECVCVCRGGSDASRWPGSSDELLGDWHSYPSRMQEALRKAQK